MYWDNEADFKLRVQIALEIVKTRSRCTGECWKCWVSWNPLDCAEEVRESKDILNELPWIED